VSGADPPRELLTVEQALDRILEHARPLASERVPLAGAAGRVLSAPARAVVDLPPFASSAMDGFAVRAADTPGTLPVVARVAAGRPADEPLPPGAAAVIATGGSVPDGADAIVPVEQALEHDSRVEIRDRAAESAHIRPRGGDVRAGDVVVPAGARLHAAQIGALAAAGVAEVTCALRPRVAVLATGSELRPAGEALGPGEIYESNRLLVSTTLARAGADVELLPVVEDEEDAHRAALEQGLEHDVLVSSGGVSMGAHDLVRAIERELGVEEVFWGVAVKPGKPLTFGVRGSTLVFGLPGNPVSSLVGSVLFVTPALLALQGATQPVPYYDVGRAATALRRNPYRDEFVRARRSSDGHGVLLEPVLGQESHMIVRAASADVLVHVPRGEGSIEPDAPVRYLTLA
jgi:molybdopterin molybdotransferase